MKRLFCVVSALAFGALLLSGCGQKEEAPPPAAPPAMPKVETPTAPEAPAMTENKSMDVQGPIDSAMALAKDGKYTEALAELQKCAEMASLTDDQKKLVNDAIAKVKEQMGGSMQNMEKSMPKMPSTTP